MENDRIDPEIWQEWLDEVGDSAPEQPVRRITVRATARETIHLKIERSTQVTAEIDE